MAKKPPTNEPTDGIFVPGSMMTKTETMRRLGWKDSAWRSARKAGLRILKRGSTRVVMASDLIRFFEETGVEEK